MRLTLRTMLCYLDDVLDPADAREMREKIEESEYASNVVHRIRTSMRRLRLGAPAPSGKGMGLDPNTVADYLDNTLPPEQVPDLERVCLDVESEVHLAEVAACHQILTLVLGEPADVPLSMRHRVYGLGHLDQQALEALASPARQGQQASPDADVAAPPLADAALDSPSEAQHRVDASQPAHKHRERPEVPEYLKAGGSGHRIWTLALVLLLLLILAGGIALTVWPRGNQPVADNNAAKDNRDDGSAEGGAPTDGDDAGKDGDDSGDALFHVDPAPPEQADGEPSDANGQRTEAVDGGDGNLAGERSTNGGGVTSSGEAGSGTDVDGAAGTGASPPIAPPIAPPTGPTGDEVASVDSPKIATPAVGKTPAGAGAGEPALPLVDKVAAHYISTGQVMVGWDNETASWRRLPARAPLKPGAALRALPTYRPQIMLTNDIQITFAGEGYAALGNPVDDVPRVELPLGQAVIATMGKAGNQVSLRAGDRDVLITMANVDAAVALSVHRFLLPGDDPEAEIAHVDMTASVISGQIQWRQGDADPITLDAGQQISMVDDALPNVSAFDEPPHWIKSNDISDIDRLASATLEPMLDEERPIEISLEERAEHPRVEVRSLAARCLASIDKFDRIIESFNDDSLKSYWSEHYDRLQTALARGPRVAAELREAIERRRGDDAPRIYRLLRGFNPDQLAAGEDKKLVDNLKSPSLDVRVLAINNLRRITGRTQSYHPHLPEVRRRTPQREWELAAQAGSIKYLNPPPDLPERKAAP